MFGLLNIDKPRGPTSRDVVNRVARLVKPHKAGHAGTLDPLATGVLVVAVGPATRLVEYVQRYPKAYRASFLLGRSSDTEDITGTVLDLPQAPIPSRESLLAALPQFLGTIEQRPPAYSALKLAGQRAYALARRGETVELPARPVAVHRLELLRYAYPELELEIECGSGTYIRSLGRDLARALGTAAVMSSLRRMAIGPFVAADAFEYGGLDANLLRDQLLPPTLAVGALPKRALNDAEVLRIRQGQPIPLGKDPAAGEQVALDPHGQLVAILEPREGKLWPAKGFGHATPGSA